MRTKLLLITLVIATGSTILAQNLSWTERDNGLAGQYGYFEMNYGGGHFFGVSRDHFITSSDGIQWTANSSNLGSLNQSWFTRPSDVVRAMGRYFMAGDGGTVASSQDGTTWNLHPLPSEVALADMYAIAYGNNMLCVAGRSATILSSPNGADWTVRHNGSLNSFFASSIHSLEFLNNRFVAIGEGVIAWSSDGMDWNVQAHVMGDIKGISYGNGLYVAFGRLGAIYTSPDAATWTLRRAQLPSSEFEEVVFDGQEFVAAGRFGHVATSFDGITWTQVATFENQWFHDVTTGVGKVIITSQDSMQTSSRGAFWDFTPIAGSKTQVEIDTVTFGAGKFAMADYSNGGRIHTSVDGITWSSTSPPELQYTGFDAMQFEEGIARFIGLPYSGAIWPSANATSWTTPTPSSEFSGDKFVASGNGRVVVTLDPFSNSPAHVSTNTLNWTKTTLPGRAMACAFGNGEFLIPLLNNKLAHSTDGVTWTTDTLPGFPGFTDAAFGNGRWVAMTGEQNYSDDRHALTSQDRITWTLRGTGARSHWKDIVFSQNAFFAGFAGVSTSSDGETWTQEVPESTAVARVIQGPLQPVAFSGTKIGKRNRTPEIVGNVSQFAIVGSPFQYQVLAHNGPTLYQAAGLPEGIAVDDSTGLITGVPSEHGVFNVQITTHNPHGTDAELLQITVQQLAPTLVNVSKVRGLEGKEFYYQILAKNLPKSFVITNLPPGLDPGPNGTINGIPTTPGVYTVGLSATNDHGTDTQNLEIVIGGGDPLFVSSGSALGTRQSIFFYQTMIHYGPATYDAVGLPDGVSINTNSGLIGGIPTVSGLFNCTITATNTFGSTAFPLSIEIRPSLADAVDSSSLVWTTGGNKNWFGQTGVSSDGQDAATPGPLSSLQSSWMQTTVNGPALVSFEWLVSAYPTLAPFMFTINSVEKARISGTSMTGWESKVFALGAGVHTLRWTFQRGTNQSAGQNTAWLDQVVARPLNTFELWASANLGNALSLPESDNDLDTIENLVEFGIGGVHGAFDVLPSPVVTPGTRLQWTATIREDPNLTVVAEFSSHPDFSNSEIDAGSPVSLGNGYAQITFIDPEAGPSLARFARLLFTYSTE